MTATLTAPAPLAPPLGGAVDAASARFAWQPAEGAERYRLQVAAAPAFAEPLLDVDAGPGTEITLADALEPTPQPRFWRVGAVDGSGETAWSRPRPFTLPEPAALPGLRAEAETAAHARASATRADEKRTASLARGRTIVPDLPPPPALPPLPTGPTISGRSSATDWRGLPGVAQHAPEASGADLAAPRVLGPLGGAIADGAATVFRWTDVPGAAGYEIEVGPDLSGPTLRVDAGTTTEMSLGGALPAAGDRLFWRARARDDAGARGPWSRYGRFYAGTDLQAAAYHDRQEAERAYARRVQEHEALRAEAALDPVAEHERPDAVSSAASLALILTMLVLGGLMVLLAAIGGMVTP